MDDLRIEIKSRTTDFQPLKSKRDKEPFLKRLFSFKIIASILIIFLLYNNYYLEQELAPLRDKSEGIIDEMGAFRNANETFANDLNEIRKVLYLPQKKYETPKPAVSEDKKLETAVLSFIGNVGQSSYKEDKVDTLHLQIQELVNADEFNQALSDSGLSFHTFYPEYDGSNVYTFLGFRTQKEGALAFLKGNIVDGSFLIDAINEDEQLGTNLAENLVKAIKEKGATWIAARKTLLERKSFIESLNKDKEFVKSLADKRMRLLVRAKETDESFTYSVNGQYGLVLEVGLLKDGGKYFIKPVDAKQSEFDSDGSFISALDKAVSEADLRSPVERMVEVKKSDLENIFGEEAFQFFLKEFAGELASEPKEEPDRYIYELKRGDQLLGSVILEKGTGLVKVLKPGERIPVNVFDFVPETKKKL